jgi:L-alanine-DL-glutamate epimerase-like enolase superfamily enzyme
MLTRNSVFPALKIRFSLELITLPLRYEWKLSRNTSTKKINGLITASFGSMTGIGEIAPNVRYGESPERVREEFDRLIPQLEREFSEDEWPEILQRLPACQALKMGLDMAVQNLLSAISGIPVSQRFGLKDPGKRAIGYTIPVMDPAEIEGFLVRENLHRFQWLKVKVNRDLGREMMEEVLRLFPGPVAIDGNEGWTNPEEALAFAKSLPPERILFLEQPLPSDQKENYVWLKGNSTVEIWGDESVLYTAEPEFWVKAFHGINVKLMKAGSFANAISLLKTARENQLKTMVGCMVETSLGISAALSLESLADYMDLDGFLLLQNEPFHLTEEKMGEVGFGPKA